MMRSLVSVARPGADSQCVFAPSTSKRCQVQASRARGATGRRVGRVCASSAEPSPVKLDVGGRKSLDGSSLAKADRERYDSLFYKYSSANESGEFLTVDKFRQLMSDVDRESSRDWDEVFFDCCRSRSPLGLFWDLSSVLRDRLVAGKARRGSSKFIFLSALGIFSGFLVLCLVCDFMVQHSFFSKFHSLGAPFILGSFGTLSILVFGQANSTNIRVWNVVLGHMIGAACGLLSVKLLGYTALAKAVAMSSTLVAMLWSGAVHPPGGALALLMVQDPKLQVLGQWYVLYPALFGGLVLYFMGFLTNRLKKYFGAN